MIAKQSGALLYVSELVKIIIIAAAIILPIRLFVVQPFYVKGQSMEPNFQADDYLIVDEVSYHFREPRRGEVVVFRFSDTEKKFFIKRLIGLPGETIEIRQNLVTIYNTEHPDGFVLDEASYNPVDFSTIVDKRLLEEGEYFVMGDNRPISHDSKRFGPIDGKQIVGRVLLRGLPLGKFTLFETP